MITGSFAAVLGVPRSARLQELAGGILHFNFKAELEESGKRALNSEQIHRFVPGLTTGNRTAPQDASKSVSISEHVPR
jgi:hypothetical protein